MFNPEVNPNQEKKYHWMCSCPECNTEMVYPVEWDEAGPAHWTILLHCANCNWASEDTYVNADVMDFDESLDRQTEVIRADVNMLVQEAQDHETEKFGAEIGSFIAALYNDHILPSDIARQMP